MAKPELLDDRKFLRFVALLNAPLAHCLGYLELMWLRACNDADPFLGDDVAVKAATGYPGPAAEITQALLNAGKPKKKGFIIPVRKEDWSDSDNAPAYEIHNFLLHAPRYVRRRAERRAQRLAEGAEDDPGSIAGLCPVSGRSVAGQRPPSGGQDPDAGADVAALPTTDNQQTTTNNQEKKGGFSPYDLADLWNVYAKAFELPKTRLSEKTQNGKKQVAKAARRIKEHPNPDEWRLVIARICARPYCLGKNDTGWMASFTYLIRVETFDNHFDGKFARIAPVMLPEEISEEERMANLAWRQDVEARVLFGLDKAIELAQATEEQEVAEIFECAKQTVSALLKDANMPDGTLVAKLYECEDKTLEMALDALSDSEGIRKELEAKCKAAGLRFAVFRNCKIRKLFNVPRFDGS